MNTEQSQPAGDEKPSICFWNYIFERCGCKYIKHERAYSAFITFNCYDYQEYELDEHAAKVKLADRLSRSEYLLKHYTNTIYGK